MEAFVYCWTDHLLEKLYIGSHKGSIHDGYICSSKVMLEEYNQRPDDFTRQIIAHCETYKEARKFETKILMTTNASINENFYNKSNGKGDFCNNYPHTEQTKEKLKKAWVKRKEKGLITRGFKHTQEYKDNKSKIMKGRKLSSEHIQKLKESSKNRTQEYRNNMSNSIKLLWEKRRNGIISYPKSMKVVYHSD